MERTAGIVIIGNEILSGKFADENARFLIGELRDLGVRLQRIAVIPDDVEDIATTVRQCSDRFDLVFTSGGVGPTHDDVTMEGIARGFDTDVVLEPTLAEGIRKFFGPEKGERNLRLAEVPRGTELVPGEGLSWPVARFRNIYILPGVPQLFRRKFTALRESFRSAPYTTEKLYCRGDEGTLAADLDAVVAEHPAVEIGSYPRFGEKEFSVLLTLEGKQAELVRAAREALRERLGDRVVRVEP